MVEKVTVSYRLPEAARKIVQVEAKRLGIPQSSLLELLIFDFNERSDRAKKDLLGGKFGQDSLETLKDLVAKLAEAEHAFQEKRWIRAIDAYTELKALTELAEADAFERWINYKLAYMWIDMAYDRRNSALDNSRAGAGREVHVRNQYKLAIAAIRKSVELGKQAKGEPVEVVARFNVACAYSLRCQYEIENALILGIHELEDDYVMDMRKLLLDSHAAGSSAEEVSSIVGGVFERLHATAPHVMFVRNVENCAKDCQAQLDEIYTIVYPEQEPGQQQIPKDGGIATLWWVPGSAAKDRDLAFVRDVDWFATDFARWMGKMKWEGDPVDNWCADRLGETLEPID